MTSSATSTKRRRRQVFSSVFPVSTSITTPPTPLATPDPSFVLPGQSFGGPTVGATSFADARPPSSAAEERIRWDRAWHTATSSLSLPKESVSLRQPDVQDADLYSRWFGGCPPGAVNAIACVLSSTAGGDGASGPGDDRDLIEWYTNEVRGHFLMYVRPQLQMEDDAEEDAKYALSSLLRTLQLAQRGYMHPLDSYMIPALTNIHDPIENVEKWESSREEAVRTKAHFRRNLHALMAYSLPQECFSRLLQKVLTTESRVVLGLDSEDEDSLRDPGAAQEDLDMSGVDNGKQSLNGSQGRGDMSESRRRRARQTDGADSEAVRTSRQTILAVFRSLEDVGLGREKGQRVFAEVMHRMMSDYVQTAFADLWSSPSTVPQDLQYWVENRYARLVVEVLHCLQSADESGGGSRQKQDVVGLADVQKWGEMAVGRLGRMRVDQLFDIVVDWDASRGAVEDLKSYITTPMTRTHLTTSFGAVIAQRLLHPGASTIEILQIYISLIKSFGLLDPKGVLLDRVARPIRRYLKEREDTVKVIVTGLLADVDEDLGSAPPDVLVELAIELNQASELAGQGEDDGDLDWNDLSWMPDPIDAGPDYKKSKGSDVVGSLISLFDSKDVFVKEFQNIMGERLLKRDLELEKEERVLELLKLRFGDGALQSCEVMLRDVSQSRGIDRNVRVDQALHLTHSSSLDSKGRPNWTAPDAPEVHAKILSRLFWPELRDDSFAVPPEIAALQSRYEVGYEKLKQSRKLTWLNALGQARVELDLADRVVTEEVQTWQASVIHAFQDGAPHSVPQLAAQLRMPEPMVRNALTFWVGKLVLREASSSSDAVYTVLETLPRADHGAAAAAARAATAATASAGDASASSAAVRAPVEASLAKFEVYWQFIVGMLTNGGPMAAPQIAGMLRLAVAGGGAFSEDELRDFLAVMVHEEKLDVLQGGRYRVRT
ncbi:MAG: hypothetical protein M1832_002372 [Thelocarpon impressellum]|nr:MAG: hypothetical protein M1832_002372 [Thelocarpon impressellum]